MSVNESETGLRFGLNHLHHYIFLGAVLAQAKQ